MIGSDFCFTRSKATHSPISQLADESSYVTGIGRSVTETHAADLTSPTSTSPRPPLSLDAEPARPTIPARIRWAVLLARIYEVLPLLCPACGGLIRISVMLLALLRTS